MQRQLLHRGHLKVMQYHLVLQCARLPLFPSLRWLPVEASCYL